MAEKFLNDRCTFKCLNCAAVKLRPVEISQHRTKFEGGKVLTTSTQVQLMIPGVCPNLPQNPAGPNCIAPFIQGSWTKVSKHTAGGKNLLLTSSEFTCALGGGKIVADNSVRKVVQETYSPFVLSVAGLKDKNASDMDSVLESEKTEALKKTSNGSDKKRSGIQNKKAEKGKEQEEAVADLYCPYDPDKPKCAQCEYRKAGSEHMESAQQPGNRKQPAAILRENYENAFETLESTRRHYKKTCSSVGDEYDLFHIIGCGNAAHHILSTKDVYEQNKLKFVLKLANFYKYDVNEAYNCIILPGLNAFEERNKGEFQAGFGQISQFDKRRFKYEAMRRSGRQWHGGGHGRDFENEHNISCYAIQVTDLLYSYMKNDTKQHCRIDDAYYEKDRERFVRTIHRVIDIVREKLILFETNPQKSLPYYVSGDAYDYAYKVMNIRLLVFRKNGAGVEVYKYSVISNHRRTYADERGRRIFELNHNLSVKLLIAFCEQIDVAYFDESQGRIRLPFSVANIVPVNMGGISIKEYLNANISAVEAEVAGMNRQNKNVMKNRLSELGR